MRVDSLTKFDELVATGLSPDQARVLAHSLSNASEIDMINIATKDDVRHLEKIMYIFGALITLCLGYLMFIK